LPETYRFISRDHIEHGALCIEVLFGLGWWDIPNRAKQAAIIESVDPSEGGHF
jgi:hypothetical protein